MASVSRCDTCGKVGEHEDFIFVRLYREKNTGAISTTIDTVEICSECYDKLKELLDI